MSCLSSPFRVTRCSVLRPIKGVRRRGRGRAYGLMVLLYVSHMLPSRKGYGEKREDMGWIDGVGAMAKGFDGGVSVAVNGSGAFEEGIMDGV